MPHSQNVQIAANRNGDEKKVREQEWGDNKRNRNKHQIPFWSENSSD